MAAAESFPKEFKIPGILLAIGVSILMGYGFLIAGTAGAIAIALVLPLVVVKNIVPGLAAGIVVAKFMGADYGDLASAFVKFAAIIFFALGLTFFIRDIGFIVQAGIWVGLLIWLFEMTPKEAVTLAIVAVIVNFMLHFLLGITQALSPR